MNCKFCNAEVGEEHKFCPYCGKALDETLETVSTETEEMTAAPAGKEKNKLWVRILAIAGAVVALGVLVVVLLSALGVDIMPRANDIFVKDAYTVEDDKAVKKSQTVVATINGKELTNSQLQIFYRMQVLDFLNYYGSYISYMDMDYTKPLSEQTCYYDKDLTWEQYFLNIAIETWQNYQVLALLAEEAGHELAAEWQESLDNLPSELQKQAEEGKYESVDALLQDVIGPGCNQEEYLKYVRLVYLSNDYYNVEAERLAPTQEEIEAYFTEHAATFEENGITKDSGLISAVRHILLEPEGGTTNEETGETTYTEDAWKACYAEAEKILNEWKAGNATAESFGELAKTHSKDGGSSSTGGLYEGIYKGSGMTENFQNWAIDSTRKTGDTGIVKTEFGYHIMYFVEGEPNWSHVAETQLLSERTTEMINDGEEKWPMDVNYRKISLAELEL